VATLSYQGPLPLPSATVPRYQPFPTGGITVRAPRFLQGSGAVLFVLDPVLPAGLVGLPYSQTLTAGGGIAPYTFAVTSGALPAGLSLGAASGLLSGTPTLTGTFGFTVTVTDAQPLTGRQAFSLAVTVAAGANYGYTA
jgi:hypothetical protein